MRICGQTWCTCHLLRCGLVQRKGLAWVCNVLGSRSISLGTVKNSSLWWQLSVWHLIQSRRKGCWTPDKQVLLSLLVSPVPVLGQSERVEGEKHGALMALAWSK